MALRSTNKAASFFANTAIGKWRFPAPTGGGEVKVRYPFMFSSRTETLDLEKKP